MAIFGPAGQAATVFEMRSARVYVYAM